MVLKKLPFLENGFSALRNPSGRVAYVFGISLVLYLLVFHLLIPIFSNADPALSSADATPFLWWFSAFSNGAKTQGETPLGALENNLTAYVQMDPTTNSNTAQANGREEKVGSFGVGNTTGTGEQLESRGRNATKSDPAKKDEILRGAHNGTGNLSTGGGVAEQHNGGNQSTVSGGKNGTVPFDGGAESGIKANGSDEKRSFKECDIFDGRWVRDNRKPFYPPGSCPFLDTSFNCHLNGRPDHDFQKWRWQPNGCDIPRMNATDFLERLRGQRLIFVGDSLNRNMWESLVCTLRQSLAKKKRVFEISRRTQFKSRQYYCFKFVDYNCTIEFVKEPFLVKQIFVRQRTGAVIPRIRLDIMENNAFIYHAADILVFNTGHWWKHEKTGKNYFQVGNYVYPYLAHLEAYKKGLRTWARWIDGNINNDKTQVFFRGISLTHFRGGQWNSGGRCHKQTEPIYNETYLQPYPSLMLAVEETLEKMKTPVTYLNISRLTAYRKDGHPSIYGMKYKSVKAQNAAVRAQDCSHWCLPGVPDAWNELFYASLLKRGRGPWRN